MTRTSTLTQTRSAFTLIELLVVIAIIAILAAILFPVFAQAREKARQAACLSNCKQMAIAVMQYYQDYDELLPVIGDNTQCRGRWQWQIYPYIKNNQVFTCPNLPDNQWVPNNQVVSGCGPTPLGTADIAGYGWNNGLNYDNRTGTYPACPGWDIPEIKKPSETILIGDVSFPGEAGYSMYAKNPALAGTTGNSPWYYPNFRHNMTKSVGFTATNAAHVSKNVQMPVAGRANFVFLDGHAKSLDLNTAFKEAPMVNGNYNEDGYDLSNTAAPNETNSYNSHYVYWNIY